MPRKPTFGSHIRNARMKRGLMVAELAELVGVSTGSIYYWETDFCRPNDETLSTLCKALRLPVRAMREMAAG